MSKLAIPDVYCLFPSDKIGAAPLYRKLLAEVQGRDVNEVLTAIAALTASVLFTISCDREAAFTQLCCGSEVIATNLDQLYDEIESNTRH
jgi:hypothetical protein